MRGDIISIPIQKIVKTRVIFSNWNYIRQTTPNIYAFVCSPLIFLRWKQYITKKTTPKTIFVAVLVVELWLQWIIYARDKQLFILAVHKYCMQVLDTNESTYFEVGFLNRESLMLEEHNIRIHRLLRSIWIFDFHLWLLSRWTLTLCTAGTLALSTG